MSKEKVVSRRQFLLSLARIGGIAALSGIGGLLHSKLSAAEKVWQINPELCIQCGRCQINCVRKPAAVKAVHAYAVCGYCDLCSGYLKSGAALSTAAESQLCPTSAIKRSYVEDPYFEYVIDESLCIACGRCVKGCTAFGNGSLFLQIKQELCLHCNACKIAQDCPAQAISTINASEPYIIKGVKA